MNLRHWMRCFRGVAGWGIFAAFLFFTFNLAEAQPKPGQAESAGGVPALLLSDVHFEPFFDPGKAAQLAAAPVSAWKAILAAPPSGDREQRFAALEQTCHTRGEDTSFALWDSSLRAIRRDAAGAKFVTISGDLISHAFECKFAAVFPHAAAGDYRAFVQKTVDFVIDEVREALPGVPVYAALGNNDSDCGDYKLDAHSDFLRATGEEVAKGFPAAERKDVEETFAAGGYYSVRLPAPIENARLLVLNDQFMGAKFTTCGGKTDWSEAEEQTAWLRQQLTEARTRKEKVWVMAHIPPGVDGRASAAHMGEVCGEKGPKMYLASEKMTDVLVEFSDVVELAIFAHTHMDELRILKTSGNAAPGQEVAVKMVSSISPTNANAPTFTVARVEAANAQLKDFAVFKASNQTGVDAEWHEAYDWDKTYHQPDFSPASVSKVVAGFAADASGATEASRDYIGNFGSPLLSLVWPEYVCGLQNYSAQGFKACVCPAAK